MKLHYRITLVGRKMVEVRVLQHWGERCETSDDCNQHTRERGKVSAVARDVEHDLGCDPEAFAGPAGARSSDSDNWHRTRCLAGRS